LIALAVLGFWYTVEIVLNTSDPALVVVSGSMSISQEDQSAGWTHPFARTLQVGDLIIIQGVNPANLNANYPNSDIIVYHDPRYPRDSNQLIVHRIVAENEINGTLYFQTKGDGNGPDSEKWPNPVDPAYYDPWNLPNGVPQDAIVGKVVMRIPWVGYFVLFMKWVVEQPFGLPIIVALIILLVIIDYIAPLLRERKAPAAEPEPQIGAQEQS
jgi:signal peptidase I